VRKNEIQDVKAARMASCIIVGAIISLLTCLVLLLAFSTAISRGWMNEGYMTQYTFAACILGAFIGGLFSTARNGSKRLIVGVSTGVVHMLLMLAAGLLTYKNISFASRGLGWLIACVIGGVMAAVVGKGGRKRKKR